MLHKTSAIVLRSRKWGDADRLLTLYTWHFGKIRAVARGARRLKSRLGSAVEPFVHVDLNLFEKPNDAVYRVTQADIQQAFPPLREDLVRITAAGRLVNLVAALTAEGDRCVRIFETLQAGLQALESDPDPLLKTLFFEIQLLGLTGFRPTLHPCARCGGALHAGSRRFSAVSGGLVCDPCASRDPNRALSLLPGSVALLKQALTWTPTSLSRLRASGQVRHDLEYAIEQYIAVVAGKPLPSLDLLHVGS